MRIGYVFLIFLVFNFAFCDEDYYATLGVAKDATTKEIRKAFKKLALEKHPDKNPDDPSAHENFVKITNIYEVLKDEDTRKKYDQYGEEGLKDDFKGGQYESWNYYKDEFGIYDDDVEVTTLDGHDFGAATSSGEVWFVNFYSPRCSHCHELAPTWREFAKDMEGIVNIGAVNCRDNRWTCNNNGIRSYPSLVLFLPGKNPIKYHGDRNKKDLRKFLMEHVDVEVLDLWDGNLDEMTSDKKKKKLPWLVAACGGLQEDDQEEYQTNEDVEEVDCLAKQTKMKLAGMLRGVVNVASIDCTNSPKLCKKLGQTNGLKFYPRESFPDKPKKSLSFHSLDAHDIHFRIMTDLIPGLKKYKPKELEDLVDSKKALIFFEFLEDEIERAETSLKRLPMLLKEHKIYVGKVICHGDHESFCKTEMHLEKDCVIAFKGKGLAQLETFHGKINTAELTSFARDSVSSYVTTLYPDHFDDITTSKKPWFVDFFAPWCPPCRALLPELRKASLQLHNFHFGTVDCTKFTELCSMYQISSYPHTMLFNGSVVSEYSGRHNAHGIQQFVEDLIDPPYVQLSDETFVSLVQRRPPGESWMVDFYANWCGPCQAMMPEWRKMAKLLKGVVKVGSVDCAKASNKKFCSRNGIESYPEIRLFPAKKTESHTPLYDVYSGWNRGASSMSAWALKSIPSDIKDLQQRDFSNDLLKDESAWLVDFYAPWCGHCHQFAPKFTLASHSFKGRVKFGKVNCDALKSVCVKAGVHAYPSVKFYAPTKPGEKKTSNKNIESQDPSEITRIVNEFMKPYEQETKKAKDEL